MKNNKYGRAYIAAISYSIIVGLSFLFTKIALRTSDPVDVLAYRFTASFIAISIPILFKRINVSYTKEKLMRILPAALLYPLMFFSLQTFGLMHSTSSEAAIFQASGPIFTLILATYFLKEKTTIFQKISVGLSVSGVIYILIMKGSSFNFANFKGIALLLLSTLSFSGYSVMARKLIKDITNIELTYMMSTISFIVFGVTSILKHLIHGDISNFFVPASNINFIISVVYLGVLSSLASSLLTNYALSKIEASKMSVFVNLGTVISIIAGVVFLKERLYYYHI
ncbi:putative permease, partial [Gottschalkia purinilytica]